MAPPNRLLRYRHSPRDIDDEADHEVAQIDAAVEPVGERCQVGLGLLAVLRGAERASQGGLQVAENCVDPLELGQVARLDRADDLRRVNASGLSDSGKVPQAVAGDYRAGQQPGLGPLGDGLRDRAVDQIELEVDRLPCRVKRDRRYEGHLVLRASTTLSSRPLDTEVRVVDLHGAAQAMGDFFPGHAVVDLVMQQPSRWVAHAQATLERQCRKPRLGLADETDRQEPGRQRQLGVLQQGAGRQRGLMPAIVALKQLAHAVADDAVLRAGATRAAEPIGSARALERLGALRFGAKVAREFRGRHAGLEPNRLAGHRDSAS